MKPTKGRYLVIAFLIVAVFSSMIFRLYNLQLVSGEEYQARAESKTTKTMTLTGVRGTIYDSNMIPLAYDKRTYDVQFYRDPSRTSDEDRQTYTNAIIETIKLVESNGKKTIDGFWLERDENNQWRFNTGTTNETSAAKRESQWRSNFYLTGVPVENLFDQLCENYFIPDEMSEEEKIKVLAIWQESRMYNYLSEPVTIAYGVDFETVSEIEVRSMELEGISVVESTSRVYPKGSLAAHTIGYISKISGEETLATYLEKGYANDALVGMTGVEYSMEDQLTPYLQTRQGQKVVEINNRGKIIRELSYDAPVDGNDVILTIDSQLQAVLESELEKTINGIRKVQEDMMRTTSWKNQNRTELREYKKQGKEVQTAQTGAAVAIDPNSGRVLAMASYPSFDLSMFDGGSVDNDMWNDLISDERNPMYNRAISARDTPGSIFKMVTALGGLMEGVLTLDETIDDKGKYKGTDTSYQPSCWVSSANRYKHQDQTVIEGLKNSCNYFFYTVGQRLGSTNLTKWGAQLGLTSRTGIELPNESTSFVGNQLMLYDGDRAIDDQYTSKPYYSAYMIKKRLREVGEERGIEYDEERLDMVAKKLLDLVLQDGLKEEWIPQIQQILLEDMNLPAAYISKNYLVNLFYSYIQDLRWTDNETIMAAIGQSITQVTPVAVARYVAAICNGGTVYNLQLIDKVVSPTGSVVMEKEPVIINQITGAEEYLAAIQEGMKEVTSVENDGTAAQYFAQSKAKIAAKTGTAQRTDIDIENNSWLVTYAPYDSTPQIVVVVYIQNGYAGARAAKCAINTIEYYLDQQEKKDSMTIAQVNRLTN